MAKKTAISPEDRIVQQLEKAVSDGLDPAKVDFLKIPEANRPKIIDLLIGLYEQAVETVANPSIVVPNLSEGKDNISTSLVSDQLKQDEITLREELMQAYGYEAVVDLDRRLSKYLLDDDSFNSFVVAWCGCHEKVLHYEDYLRLKAKENIHAIVCAERSKIKNEKMLSLFIRLFIRREEIRHDLWIRYTILKSDKDQIAKFNQLADEFNADLDRIVREKDDKKMQFFSDKAEEICHAKRI